MSPDKRSLILMRCLKCMGPMKVYLAIRKCLELIANFFGIGGLRGPSIEWHKITVVDYFKINGGFGNINLEAVGINILQLQKGQ